MLLIRASNPAIYGIDHMGTIDRNIHLFLLCSNYLLLMIGTIGFGFKGKYTIQFMAILTGIIPLVLGIISSTSWSDQRFQLDCLYLGYLLLNGWFLLNSIILMFRSETLLKVSTIILIVALLCALSFHSIGIKTGFYSVG